jgi:hypothetical protein
MTVCILRNTGGISVIDIMFIQKTYIFSRQFVEAETICQKKSNIDNNYLIVVCIDNLRILCMNETKNLINDS